MNALWWLNEEATWPKCVHIQSWLIRLPMTVKISWKKAKQRTSDDVTPRLRPRVYKTEQKNKVISQRD